ncbi:hypothetical protein [Paenibacillus sp. DYY-L-2]|uniref:hypothetical protein n=1 Tax=Paenibacillus sp. DYY-L-2 TaxID=3447013 RepID=UPI003F4FE575
MRKDYFSLVILLVVVILTSCTNRTEKILITSPAYMYSNTVSEPIDVIIDGYFDKKEHLFKGSITFDDKIKLENVLFFPGTGLISYKGKERTNIGQIFFNEENFSYSIQIAYPQFTELLTNQKGNKTDMLIISSPANSIEQAKEVNDILIRSKLWFEE